MRIYRRNKYWYIDYFDDGKRIQKSLKTTNLKVANARKNEIEHRLYMGLSTIKQRVVTIRQAAIEYRRDIEPERRPRTNETAASRLNIIISFWENRNIMRLRDITPQAMNLFKQHLRSKNRTDLTYNHYLETVKALLNWIVRNRPEYLRENPLRHLKRLSHAYVPQIRYFSADEMQIIYKKLENDKEIELMHLCRFLANTGCRLSEALSLEKSNVNFEEDYVKIKSNPKRKYYVKTYQDRIIPLNKSASKSLEYLNKRSKGIYVIPRHDRSYWSRKFSAALKNCKIKDNRSLGNLRHTYGANHILAGTNVITLKKLMGHADIKTTSLYTILKFEDYKSIASNISL